MLEAVEYEYLEIGSPSFKLAMDFARDKALQLFREGSLTKDTLLDEFEAFLEVDDRSDEAKLLVGEEHVFYAAYELRYFRLAKALAGTVLSIISDDLADYADDQGLVDERLAVMQNITDLSKSILLQ